MSFPRFENKASALDRRHAHLVREALNERVAAKRTEPQVGEGATACVQVCGRPGENQLRRHGILVLPVTEVFCVPLWLNQTDTKQIAGAIPLQLELRGLQPRNQLAAIFDFSVITRHDTRTLILAGILPAALPHELQAELYNAFDLSVRFLALPDDALVLWREHDRFVCAITRGSDLSYFQALEEDCISPRLVQGLRCMLMSLEMQGVITPLQQIVVWADIAPDELQSLQVGLGIPTQQSERPPPRPPSTGWKLVPTTVTEARQHRKTRRWQMRGALAALAAYLIALAWILSHLYVTSGKVDELLLWKSNHAQPLTLIHDTRSAWTELRPVVDEKSYPLELLLHVSDSIPNDHLHLTLFETDDGHLLIKGEAKDISTAFQFLDHLKKDPSFEGYRWEMGQPHLLPNDLAQLQIEGTRGTGAF